MLIVVEISPTQANLPRRYAVMDTDLDLIVSAHYDTEIEAAREAERLVFGIESETAREVAEQIG